MTRPDRTRLDKKRQGNTRKDKARQEKTRPDKKRQGKTRKDKDISGQRQARDAHLATAALISTRLRSSEEVTPNMYDMRHLRQNLATPCTGSGFGSKLVGQKERKHMTQRNATQRDAKNSKETTARRHEQGLGLAG